MASNLNDGPSYPVPARRRRRSSVPARQGGNRHANQAGDEEGSISHTFLLWVFKQWWGITVPVGLVLAAITAALVMYFFVPKYEASALLKIDDITPILAFPLPNNGSQSERYVQTQLELLRQPTVLQPVLAHPEIASMKELQGIDQPQEYIRDRLKTKQVGRSELYSIQFDSPSAQDATNVVNTVAAEYIKIQSREKFDESQKVIDILEEERIRRSVEIERQRSHVVDLAKQVTGRDPFTSGEVTDFQRALSPAGAIFQSMTQTDVELEVRRAERKALDETPESAQDGAASLVLLNLQIDNQEGVRAAEQAIRDLEMHMADIKVKAQRFAINPQVETTPAYISLKDELARRQKELADVKAKLRDELLTEQKEKQEAERNQRIAKMEEEIKSLEARKESLKVKFADQLKNLESSGAKGVELEFAKAELDRDNDVFEKIASRKLAMQTELRAPARVQLMQTATLPTAPLETIPYKLLLLACSAALVAPFGLAVVREITVRRISDAEQLAKETRLRVLGEVAALPVRYVAASPNQLSGRLRRETYVFAESINSLRTNLAFADQREHQVIAVTSAAPSEGKTSVAVSLAMSISNATEEPTLVIDGDMRSPFVANMLKTKSQPGLFEVLANKCKLDDAIQRVGDSQLYVIPGGSATRNTHSVVGISEISQLLEQLRPRFKAIVVDTPPILGASESLVLAKSADAVLFCSLANISKASQVRLAIDRLEHAQVNLAGAVLSGTPTKRYEYVYGYYANRIESDK
jgi:polysaccharide biosynthesis transport protein